MKILKTSEKAEYVWRGLCNCGCAIQLEEDADGNFKHDRYGDSYYKCPCCKKPVEMAKYDAREPMEQFLLETR